MRRATTIILLLLCTISAFAQNSLKVDAPKVVSLDETFRVVFTADGKISDFHWDGLEDFSIVWGPQTGTEVSTSIVNGKRTSTHKETYSYLLQAKAEGTFTLPGATAKIDKKEYSSGSASIEVVKVKSSGQQQQSAQQSNQDDGGYASSSSVSNEDIFLKLTVNKTNVVKGEPITATLKLYTKVDIAGFENAKFPTFNGFWNKEIVVPDQIEFLRENLNGEIYNAALIRRYVLIPQQSGTITIDPAQLVCLLRIRSNPSSQRSIFDDFFDNYQTIRKRLFTPEIAINVRNLPENAPATFYGGVGDFSVKSSFSKDSLKAHDAASFTITVSGKGNISMIEAPKIDFPSDFEVYDVKTTEKISNDGVSGSKTFEYPFIPRSHGDFTIPEIKYSYYDIAKGKYNTLNLVDISVKVGKGDESADGGVVIGGVTKQSVRSLAEDIRYIAIGNPSLKEKGVLFAGSLTFYIIIAALVVLFFIVSALMKRAAARRQDVVGSKNRKANKVARGRLKLAGDYLKQNLSSAYYEELHKALSGYISDKLAIPVADLSKERISDVLSDCGVDRSLTEEFLSIIDACEFARYAPDTNLDAMEHHYNHAVKVISELEGKVRNNNSGKRGAKMAMVALLVGLSAINSLNVMGQEAQDAQIGIETLWEKANEAYSQAQYQNALNYYLTIEGENLVSPQLYYNIGNAYFKSGDNPHAILYYERALKLDPSYEDAKNNLTIAQDLTLDRIESVPDFILTMQINKIKYWFSADVWAWICVALFVIVIGLLLRFRFASTSGSRKVSFIFACIVMVLVLFTFLLSMSQRADTRQEDFAIVTAPVSSVKSSPRSEDKTVFVLHEGTKVELLDDLGDWHRIELSDGRQGWISTETIEVI